MVSGGADGEELGLLLGDEDGDEDGLDDGGIYCYTFSVFGFLDRL
jgi:hypothetical protein